MVTHCFILGTIILSHNFTMCFVTSWLILLLLYDFLLLQVVFSDESTITVLDDRAQTVRRRPGEEFMYECLKKTVKFPT